MHFTNTDLAARAMAAYFRYPRGEVVDQPAGALTEVVEHDGSKYVVLSNTTGPLAAYRLRPTGMLMRLDELPEWLATDTEVAVAQVAR